MGVYNMQIFAVSNWQESFSVQQQTNAIDALENGKLIFFPQLAFALSESERALLSPNYVNPKTKNISFNIHTNKIGGVVNATVTQQDQFRTLLQRFSQHATQLIHSTFPVYASLLTTARTSLRPVQISGRSTSVRKDDKRLHVDAFPSSPNQGKRILRVFCNINPQGEERVWRLGEPFENVAQRFLSKINPPIPGSAKLLRLLKVTKSYRTKYDHYMLQIHDRMKMDEEYQRNVMSTEIRLPANSTWMVQTDHVSHAVVSGQHMLEQTFYLPVTAMKNQDLSPLKILERLTGQKLI